MSKYGPLVRGVARKDGRVFKGYQKQGDRVYEQWCWPDALEAKRIRQAKWHIENHKRKMQDPEWVSQRREYMRERMRSLRRSKPEQQLLIRARKRAKDKGLPFDLDYSDVLIPDRCPVLGITLGISDNHASDKSPELDRIDNTKGYVKGNVIVVSRRANRIKNDSTVDELALIAKFYTKLNRRKK